MKFNDKQVSVYRGNKLKIEIFGASHAKEIGVVVQGLKGCRFDQDQLQLFLDRRRAKNTAYSTKRLEKDVPIFTNGYKNGVIKNKFRAVIKNKAQHSGDYANTVKIPRPSHADYVAWQKYGDGFDYRGGGKFSGRMTAPLCIVGGICKQVLLSKGINVCAFISAIGKVNGKSYTDLPLTSSTLEFEDEYFPLLDQSVKAQMNTEIENAVTNGDSVGGRIDCVITGVPVGTGEFMFDSIESVISHLAFAVPAVKGVEFGKGFEITQLLGSQANDSFYYDENGEVKTKTNNNGGINGGIANGMPITFRVAIKPTPSISKEQDTVNLIEKQNVKLKIQGRHDGCIVPRAVPVIEAIACVAIYDLLNV